MCVCVRLSNLIACVLYLFISFADKYKQDYLILGLPDKQRHVGTEFYQYNIIIPKPNYIYFLIICVCVCIVLCPKVTPIQSGLQGHTISARYEALHCKLQTNSES